MSQQLLRIGVNSMHSRRNKSEEFLIVTQKVFWLIVLPVMAMLGFQTNVPIFAPGVFWIALFLGIAITVLTHLPVQFEYDHHTQKYYDRRTGRFHSRARVDTTREILKGIGIGMLVFLVGGQIGALLNEAWNLWEVIGAFAAVPVVLVELRMLLFDFVPYTGRSALMSSQEYQGLGDAPEHWNRAADLKKQQQWDEAIAHYKMAADEILARDSGNKRLADVYFQIGTCLMLKRYPEYVAAIHYFDKATEIDPNDIGSIYKRGVCYGKLGNHSRAKEEFMAVLQKDPKNETAAYALDIANGRISNPYHQL